MRTAGVRSVRSRFPQSTLAEQVLAARNGRNVYSAARHSRNRRHGRHSGNGRDAVGTWNCRHGGDGWDGRHCGNCRQFGALSLGGGRTVAGSVGVSGTGTLCNNVGAEGVNVGFALGRDDQRREALGGFVQSTLGEGGAEAKSCCTCSVHCGAGGGGCVGLGCDLIVGDGCFAGYCCMAGSVCGGGLGGGLGGGSGQLRRRGTEQFVGGLLCVGREGAGNSCDAGSTDGQGARGENSGGDFAGGENSEQRHMTLQNVENNSDPAP